MEPSLVKIPETTSNPGAPEIDALSILVVTLVMAAASTLTLLGMLLPKMNFSISQRSFFLAACISAISVVANIYALKAIKLAPNPGYAIAVYSSSFVLVTLVSVFMFHSSLTPIEFVGVIAIFTGLLLLNI